ncbi:MAG: LysM peptidoglycan-binding domain-containing protein [Myxococcota bacterium]
MRSILISLTVLAIAAPGAGLTAAPVAAGTGHALVPEAPADLFPLPPSLEGRVRFWIRIYSEVGTDGGLLHDPDDLAVVYQVVRYPGVSSRTRERKVKADKKRYASILRTLAGGKRTGLSKHEARVLALFPKGVSNKTLSHAARRVRFQLGQADKFRAGIARSGAWEDYIRGVLHERGVPEQLGALPHVESSFNPSAHSHAGASGIWQFTRGTGRRYMRVDHVIDERRDPLLATVAAARLLRANYESTGAWPLAITAYNHGAAGMRRAVSRLGTRDIGVIVEKYSSRTFGFASRNFYAEFLAALHVSMNHQEFFGEVERHAPAQPEIVLLDAHYAPKTLAKAFGVPVGDLRSANLALLSPVWDGQKLVPAGYGLRLPRNPNRPDGEVVLASIDASHRFSEQKRDRRYRVRRGDTLSKIARRFHVRESELMALNGLRSRNRIRAGQTLRLPLDEASPSRARVAREAPPSDGRYTVRRGDSLSAIAARFGVSQSSLSRANGLRNRNTIRVGQVLRIPGAGETLAAVAEGPTLEYRVKRGDNLTLIAKRHGVKVSEIMARNGMRNGNHLKVGQKLRLPGAAEAPEPSTPTSAPGPEPTTQLAAVEPAREEAPAGPPPASSPAARAETETAASRTKPTAAQPAPAPVRPASSSVHPMRLEPARYAVRSDGSIRVEPEETLGHYADWLDIPTQRLRNKNRFRSDRALTLGRRVTLDFSRVQEADFEKRRMAYHQGLVDSFFLEHKVADTQDYVLKRGDTLWVLSHRKLAVPVWLLAAYNPEVDFATPLKVGQRLRVPRLESTGS